MLYHIGIYHKKIFVLFKYYRADTTKRLKWKDCASFDFSHSANRMNAQFLHMPTHFVVEKVVINDDVEEVDIEKESSSKSAKSISSNLSRTSL